MHSEAIDFFAGSITPNVLGPIVRTMLVQGRKLDHGNPNPGNLGSDFGRLGMRLWTVVAGYDRRNADRQAALETLNTWRNAIAHQDWNNVGTLLRLKDIRAWRSACRVLASHFDRAVGMHLTGLVGRPPW